MKKSLLCFILLSSLYSVESFSACDADVCVTGQKLSGNNDGGSQAGTGTISGGGSSYNTQGAAGQVAGEEEGRKKEKAAIEAACNKAKLDAKAVRDQCAADHKFGLALKIAGCPPQTSSSWSFTGTGKFEIKIYSGTLSIDYQTTSSPYQTCFNLNNAIADANIAQCDADQSRALAKSACSAMK